MGNLSTSGFLLLLVGFLLLAGFLTGNLDRWMAYLFDPARPSITGATPGFGGGSSGGGGGGAGGSFSPTPKPSVQQQTTGKAV